LTQQLLYLQLFVYILSNYNFTEEVGSLHMANWW